SGELQSIPTLPRGKRRPDERPPHRSRAGYRRGRRLRIEERDRPDLYALAGRRIRGRARGLERAVRGPLHGRRIGIIELEDEHLVRAHLRHVVPSLLRIEADRVPVERRPVRIAEPAAHLAVVEVRKLEANATYPDPSDRRL